MTVEEFLNDLERLGVTKDDYHRRRLIIDHDVDLILEKLPGSRDINLTSLYLKQRSIEP